MFKAAYSTFILYNVTQDAVHDMVRVCVCVFLIFKFSSLKRVSCGGLSPSAVRNELKLKQNLNSGKQM